MAEKLHCTEGAPFLDTIETSCTNEFSPNLNDINTFQTSELENVYIDLSNFEYYKKQADNICSCLFSHAPAFIGGGYVMEDNEGNTHYFEKILSSESPLRNKAFLIEGCGTRLGFDNEGVLKSANFCRLRICPMCQRRRALKVASEFDRIMKHLDCSWIHLVLTVPNCKDFQLSHLLDTMQTCSSRLFRLNFVKKAFKGIARCTEVSYNSKSDEYHPHFHCLVAVNKSYFTSRDYIQILKLRKYWTVIVNQAFIGVNVRAKSDSYFDMLVDDFSDDQIVYQCHIGKANDKAVAEIAKYCVKPLELALTGTALYKPLEVIYYALHSRRLVQMYGTIAESARELRVDLDTIEDDADLDNNQLHIYNWDCTRKKYTRMHF